MPIRRKTTWICLIALAVGINILSRFPAAVERYYSRGLYPVIARVQRILFGWIPFSIGDILYLAAGILLLYGLVRFISRLVRRQLQRGWGLRLLRQVVFVLLWIYVVFYSLWGLNYSRLGIADQLQLTVRPYTAAELGQLTGVLLGQLNTLDSLSRVHRADLGRFSVLRAGAVRAYDSLGVRDEQFAYRTPSVKASLFSYPGAYIGFAGYYNPFSGEAQVNTVNPLFGLPYTTCHEMGHQLGYAKENEANFIGYLAARSSPDPAFRYSVCLDLYVYAMRELRFRDSAMATALRDRMGPGIRQDLEEWRRFGRRFANPVEPLVWKAYGHYLHANHQPKGIATYSEVTAWLIAYANKYGWDRI